MSPLAKWEYMKMVYDRYRQATRKVKKIILDEFCKSYDCHRKHAIRLLNGAPPPVKRPKRRRRPPTYGSRLLSILEAVWIATDYHSSTRLKAALLRWMPKIRRRFKLTPEQEKQLLSISPAQIDRRLKDKKIRLRKKIYGTTKPGTLLKHHIPIKTDSWNVRQPGFTEIDLVSHSGNSADGHFAHTLDMTDIFTTWVERRCVLGKGQEGVRMGVDEIRQELPFDLLGIDTDNGSEFINDHLYSYCKGDPNKAVAPIQFTRGRPYKKDDNAHIEQKNWTHVRKLLGYGRYETQEVVDAINDLYRHELRYFQNLFQPSAKLVKKTRIGSKVKRVYDDPKTPLERVIESKMGDPVKVARLEKLFDQLDPFELSKIVNQKLKIICGLASKFSSRPTVSAMSKRQREFFKQNRFHDDWMGGPMRRLPGSVLDKYRGAWYKDALMETR